MSSDEFVHVANSKQPKDIPMGGNSTGGGSATSGNNNGQVGSLRDLLESLKFDMSGTNNNNTSERGGDYDMNEERYLYRIMIQS